MKPHPFIAKLDNRRRARRVLRGLAALAVEHESMTKSWIPWHLRNARYYEALHDASFLSPII